MTYHSQGTKLTTLPSQLDDRIASSPGPTQILSRSRREKSIFLHGCEIKSGWGLGTRLMTVVIKISASITYSCLQNGLRQLITCGQSCMTITLIISG